MLEPTPEEGPLVGATKIIMRFGDDAEAVADRLIKVAEVDNCPEDIAFWKAIRLCIDELRKKPGMLHMTWG